MLLISNKTFEKDKQKYLDLVDQEERVIVKLRKNKAYALTALSEEMVADFEVHAYFCQNDHSIQIEDMLVISNKTFEKDKQKYLDLIDQQERVIVKFRKTKAYALTALTKRDLDDEIYFSDPQIMARLEESMAQVARGETHRLTEDDLKRMKEELAEMEKS